MKKSVIYLGLALVAFGNVAMASNEISTVKNPVELTGYAANPLNVAISKGEIDLVKKFIEYGADINETTNGLTPLMYAARYNQVEIIKLLLEKGANLKVKDERGFTALNHAENSKATEAVELLKNYSRK